MSTPRPYTATQRHHAVAMLRALADELDRPDAGRIQQAQATAIDDGYSSTASGAGDSGGGGGGTGLLTATERKATRRDPIVTQTLELLAAQQRLLADVVLAYRRLTEWRSDRPVALCPEGHVIDRRSARCQWVDEETGRRCGSRSEAIRTCQNPHCVDEAGEGPVRLLAGQQRWKAVAVDLPGKPEVHECNRCAKYRRRHDGRSWALATRLAVPGVNELGAYHSEDPWAEEAVASGG